MSDNLKYIQTIIKHRVDTVSNWELVEEDFIPLDGELIIYRGSEEVTAAEGSEEGSQETIHFKVGDGQRTLKDLPFAYDKELLALASAITNEATLRTQSIDALAADTARKSEGVFYIEGHEKGSSVDATNKISVWAGTCSRIDELTEGLTIRYKIPVAGNTTTKLKLTYGSGKSETTSESTIYRFNDTKLTTQFPVGSIITLIYHSDLNSGCWITNDYDSNTNTQMRVYRQTTGYNADYPLLVSRTKAADIAKKDDNGSYEGIYGVMWNDTTKVPTLNPSTGEVKAPKFTGNGSSITDINAGNITSGTLNSDRLNILDDEITGTKVYKVGQNSNGNLVVSVPWVDTNTAHTHSAGVGLTLVDSTNTGGTSGSVGYKAKLKSETALTQDALSADTISNNDRLYPVQVDKSGNLAVNVPWVDTDTNKTHSGIALSSTKAATAAKLATLPNFALSNSQNIILRITTSNTAANPTLNINSTGAKSIKIGNANTAANASNFPAGDYLGNYDGTNWVLTRIYLTDTTYESKAAANKGTDLSLVTTGEKYNWNNAYIPTSKIGAASGVAPLNTSSKIDSTYLPSYVDDVLEYDKKESFPAVGETGKIYVDTSTNTTWRWSGSTYVEIVSSVSLSNDTPWMSGTAAAGSANTASRSDHIHPSDTSRLAIAGGDMEGAINFKLGAGEGGLSWKSINNLTPYVGYSSAQSDGTFVLMSVEGNSYAKGLAIGGSTKNLLWKGEQVATLPAVEDIVDTHAEVTGNSKVKGHTIVWPASSCSTYTSDEGAATPKAMKKALFLFIADAINNPGTDGTGAVVSGANRQIVINGGTV